MAKAPFKKSVALDSNTNRLTLEGALTIAAIGLMVALVLQSEAMAGQNEEMGPENPLSFDSTRTPSQQGPVRFRPGDDLRLKGVAPYAVAEASPLSPIEPLAVDRPFLAPYEPVVGFLPTGSIAAGSGGRAPTGSTGYSGGGGGGGGGGTDGGGGGGGGGPSYGAGTNFGTGAVGPGGAGAAGAATRTRAGPASAGPRARR